MEAEYFLNDPENGFDGMFALLIKRLPLGRIGAVGHLFLYGRVGDKLADNQIGFGWGFLPRGFLFCAFPRRPLSSLRIRPIAAPAPSSTRYSKSAAYAQPTAKNYTPS